jgi:hypothetical protein
MHNVIDRLLSTDGRRRKEKTDKNQTLQREQSNNRGQDPCLESLFTRRQCRKLRVSSLKLKAALATSKKILSQVIAMRFAFPVLGSQRSKHRIRQIKLYSIKRWIDFVAMDFVTMPQSHAYSENHGLSCSPNFISIGQPANPGVIK